MKMISFLLLAVFFFGLACGNRIAPTGPDASTNRATSSTPSTASVEPTPSPSSSNSKEVATAATGTSDPSPDIQKIIAEQLGLKPEEIGLDTPLSKLRKPADELDVVEIVMNVEERFNIQIKDDEVGGGDLSAVTNVTARQLAALVSTRQKRK